MFAIDSCKKSYKITNYFFISEVSTTILTVFMLLYIVFISKITYYA